MGVYHRRVKRNRQSYRKIHGRAGLQPYTSQQKKGALRKTARRSKGYGNQGFSVEAELSDLDSVQAMLDEIDRMGTEVDIVLNNAGMQIAYRTDYFKTLFPIIRKALR